MGDRAAKLRKLDDFRRALPHISASALSAVLNECAKGGAPEVKTRKAITEAVHQELGGETPYGSLLASVGVVEKDGSTLQMLTINPLALLYKAYKQGGSFTDLMQRRFVEKPSSPENPWRLIMYADEVTPGNVLAHANKRKIWVLYFSFLEFGPLALQSEEAWLCNVVKRSADVARLSAGISQIFAASLKLFFGQLTFDLSTGGVALECPEGSQTRLFAQLGMIVQDGGAHKLVWHCKGDAGTKLCMLCRNLISCKSSILGEDGTSELKCSIIHEEALDFATDADIRGTIARLAQDQKRMAAGVFQLRQQACGFNFEPHGLLMDKQLLRIVKPVSQFCHDWMHCVLYNGIFQTVMHLVLTAFSQAGFRNLYNQLAGFIELWEQPRQWKSNSLSQLFSQKAHDAHKRAKTYKCNAGEALGLYSIFAVFIASIVLPWGKCAPEARAYLA
jgi:hypothetical protein